jgi:hypothetical protein
MQVNPPIAIHPSPKINASDMLMNQLMMIIKKATAIFQAGGGTTAIVTA